MSRINKFWFAFKWLNFSYFIPAIILVSMVPVIYLLFYQNTIALIKVLLQDANKILTITEIIPYVVRIFGTLLCTQLCHFFSAKLLAKSFSDFKFGLKNYLFEQFISIKMRYIQTHDTAFIERQITEYPENFVYLLQTVIQNILPFFLAGFIIIYHGFIFNRFVGVLYISWASVIFGGIFLSIGYINKSQEQFTINNGLHSDFITENIRNFVVNKIFPDSFRMNQRQFSQYQEKSNKPFSRFMVSVGLYRLIFGMINCSFFCGVIFFILKNKTGFFPVELILIMDQATKFTSASWDVMTSALPIVQYFGKINTYGGIIEIFQISENKHNISEIRSINIKNLNFAYEEKVVFRNFNCQINQGDRVWLKAPSGGGKSTLINILAGLLSVPRDSVFVNNTDISDISSSSLIENISLVTQNDFIFHDSILNNVKRGNLNLSDKEIQELSVNTYLNKIGLPSTHECGYKGSKVSVGQAKTICLTRALAKFHDKPSKNYLLILDEVFVGCDKKIVDVLITELNSLKNVTLIVCDHTQYAERVTNKIIEL